MKIFGWIPTIWSFIIVQNEMNAISIVMMKIAWNWKKKLKSIQFISERILTVSRAHKQLLIQIFTDKVDFVSRLLILQKIKLKCIVGVIRRILFTGCLW